MQAPGWCWQEQLLLYVSQHGQGVTGGDCFDLGSLLLLQALLNVVDSTPLPLNSAAADSGSPLKISLFSLGNMSAHAECAEVLLQLGIQQSLARFSGCSDATVQKYVQRILAKLQQAKRRLQ